MPLRPVPDVTAGLCKPTALAAHRLEREGLARWNDGTWRLREVAKVRGARLMLAWTARRRPGPASPLGDAA